MVQWFLKDRIYANYCQHKKDNIIKRGIKFLFYTLLKNKLDFNSNAYTSMLTYLTRK